MEQEVIEQILRKYGVVWRQVLPPQKGYRNSSYAVVTNNEPLNLIMYKAEPHILDRIKNANAVSDFLAHQGFATRHTRGAIIKVSTQRYACLYNYLRGHTIAWEDYTMERLKNLGRAMSDMHAALQSFNAGALPSVVDENVALHARMQRYFADRNVQKALRQKCNLRVANHDFTKVLQHGAQLPDQQALHMDFVRGNILFNGEDVSGVIDFEKTARGHIIFDVARTLAFLLVDCPHKPAHKITKYFLQSGYGKRGANTLNAQTMLQPLVTFFLVHDFYKFLRHNPYEFLHQNHHFVRTRDLLQDRGILQ